MTQTTPRVIFNLEGTKVMNADRKKSLSLAHKVLSDILKAPLSLNETRIMIAIHDKTLNFGKTIDILPISQISEITGINKGDCSRIIKRLHSFGMIIRLGKTITLVCDTPNWNIKRDGTRSGWPERKLNVVPTNEEIDKLVPSPTDVGTITKKKLVAEQDSVDTGDSSGDLISSSVSQNLNFPIMSQSMADAIPLTQQLYDQIKEFDPKFKIRSRKGIEGKEWLGEMEKIIRIDERSPDQIRQVLKYIATREQNGWCWQDVILSPSKLRQKYTQILAQVQRKKGSFGLSNTVEDTKRLIKEMGL